MKIQTSTVQPHTYVVTLAAGELIVASGKPVPFPFYLGTFTVKPGKAPRWRVGTPAASVPRGYKAAARSKMEEIVRQFVEGRIAVDAPAPVPVPAARVPQIADAADRAEAVAAARQARGDSLTQAGYQRASVIVARRQAALRDNGEEERNTSA